MEDPADMQPIMSKKKKRIIQQMSPQQREIYDLSVFLKNCCKKLDLDGAMKAYLGAKQRGIYPPKDTFNTLLALAAGLGEQGSGSFPVRTEEPPSDIVAAFTVFEDAKSVGASIHEAAYSGLIRCCSLNQRHADGLILLREMQALGMTPRIRSYSAMLAAYCASLDESQSIILFEELTGKYHLQPSEKDYIAMLQLFCTLDSSTRFYATLHSLMEDVLVPSKELWGVLTQWFTSGNRSDTFRVATCVASETGVIETQGYTLRPVELSPENKSKLLAQIEESICGEGGPAPRKRKHKVITPSVPISAPDGTYGNTVSNTVSGDEELVDSKQEARGCAGSGMDKDRITRNPRAQWAVFKAWIADRCRSVDALPTSILSVDSTAGEHAEGNMMTETPESETADRTTSMQYVDVVIDGANVGYYQQNFEDASGFIDYFQLDAMVRHLIQIGRHPLLILHCRHVYNDSMPAMYRDVIKSWQRNNILYVTPVGCNDDTFWLYLTLHLGCDVVTNDEMRDHHFQMLSPRYVIVSVPRLSHRKLSMPFA